MRIDLLLEQWLGPLVVTRPASPPSERALFVGAGYAKSVYGAAPTFRELVPEAVRRLRAAGMWQSGAGREELDPGEVFEALTARLGRLRTARAILSEPHISPHGMALAEHPLHQDEWPLPLDSESVWRTLGEWRRAASYNYRHLSPLNPRRGVALLGRLVAERAINRVLSLSWDAYLELGCLLVGLPVVDEHDTDGESAWNGCARPRIRVYERASDATLNCRGQGDVDLFKLHGGVRTLHHLLDDVQHRRLTPENAELELRQSFMVSSSDLVSWREQIPWVRELVMDTMASHATLFLGVSFSDPAVFQAVREQIKRWEDAARQIRSGVAGRQPRTFNRRADGARRPHLAAITRSTGLRVRNAMRVSLPPEVGYREIPRYPNQRAQEYCGAADAVDALRCAYAWHLGQILLRALLPDRNRTAELLEARLRDAVQRRSRSRTDGSSHGPTAAAAGADPVELLCDALGPSARWAALAERRPPFSPFQWARDEGLGAFLYAPWNVGLEACHGVAENLRLIARVLAALTAPSSQWQAAVSRVGEWVEIHRTDSRMAPVRRIWFWPWPWPVRFGLHSPYLTQALRSALPANTAGHGTPLPQVELCPLIANFTEDCATNSLWVGSQRVCVKSWKTLYRELNLQRGNDAIE